MKPRKRGDHRVYSAEKHQTIIKSIKRNAPYEIAAWAARISESTLYNWLSWGREDLKNGKYSIYAHLLEDVLSTESEKVMQHLDCIEAGQSGWHGRLKILERRWRKFFGADSGIIQDLIEIIEKLKQDITIIKINHGGMTNGREMDSSSNKEQGCITQEIGSEERKTDFKIENSESSEETGQDR